MKNAKILINGELNEMTKDQIIQYKHVLNEAESVILAKKEEQVKKEIAISKLVALGLTEEDLRLAGL